MGSIKMIEIVYFVGLLKLAELLWWVATLIKKHTYKRPEPLAEKYGKESWALVTGASDGMGAEYCR